MRIKLSMKALLLIIIFSLIIQIPSYASESVNTISIEQLEDNIIEFEEISELLKFRGIKNKNNQEKNDMINLGIKMAFEKLKSQEIQLTKINNNIDNTKYLPEYKTLSNIFSRYLETLKINDEKENYLSNKIENLICINDSIVKQINALSEYEELITNEINYELKNTSNIIETENKIKRERLLQSYVKSSKEALIETNKIIENTIISTFDFKDPISIEIEDLEEIETIIANGYSLLEEGPEFEELNDELDIQIEHYKTQNKNYLNIKKSNEKQETQNNNEKKFINFFIKNKNENKPIQNKLEKIELIKLNLIELEINQILMKKEWLK